jgi:GGDEF domain-containing protein
MAVAVDPTTEPLDLLTGFGNRDQLMADLTAALAPGSPPSVFAVFELAGMSEYRRVHGERAGDGLTTRLADVFAHVVRPKGSCYLPRRDEFCVLIAGTIDDDEVKDVLPTATWALRDEGASSKVGSCYGACALPAEATHPIAALKIADERLFISSETRARRERRKDPRRHRIPPAEEFDARWAPLPAASGPKTLASLAVPRSPDPEGTPHFARPR